MSQMMGRISPGVSLLSDKRNWALDEELRAMRTTLTLMGIPVHQSPWTLSNFLFYLDRHEAVRKVVLQSPWHHLTGVNLFHGFPWTSADLREKWEVFRCKSKYFDLVRVSHLDMKNFLEEEIPSLDTCLVRIGVDDAIYRPVAASVKSAIRATLGIPSSAFVVGSFLKDGLGWGDGLEPKVEKGPDIFLKTLALVKSQIDELFVLLSGPARGFVKTGLSELRIPYRHHIASGSSSMASLYHSADVALITSRDEGGPKSAMEALASGVALVSTPVGQTKDLVVNGSNGWLSNSFDPEELANLLMRVYENPTGTVDLGLVTALENNEVQVHEQWAQLFAKVSGDGF